MTEQQGRSRRRNRRGRPESSSAIPLILIGLVIIAPFLWMMSQPSKTTTKCRVSPFATSGRSTVVEFREGVMAIPFARYMLNSMIVSFSVMAGQLLVASLSAYAFARLEFPGGTRSSSCSWHNDEYSVRSSSFRSSY